MKSSANFSEKPSNPPKSGSPRRSFSLVGAAVPLDPRVNAVRSDLADLRLAEYVFAPHYAAPMACVANRQTDILTAGDPGSKALSEILPGEMFELFEISRSFGWGMCCADGSVGFLDRAALDVTHADSIAEPLPGGGDHVTAAESILQTPYKAGGRSPLGVDPGGMVFYALQATGLQAMRFLDLQAATIGYEVVDELPTRGDIVFFANHAAIMRDASTAVFVAEDAPVSIYPLADIVQRDGIGPITARRRLA